MTKKINFNEMTTPLFGTKEELTKEIQTANAENCYSCDECDCWCDCDNDCCDTPTD